MLRLLPVYKDASLLRSRDSSKLATCDIVVDVGGEYNAANHRYDHHQRTFDTSFPDRSTKLSSAGLVWLHFGKSIIAAETGLSEDAPEVQVLWEKLYLDFLEAIDANDNGISLYDTARLAEAGIEQRFRNSGNSISAVVGDFNPDWNDPTPSDPEEVQRAEDARFLEASRFIGDLFQRKLKYYAKSWLPARTMVLSAYADRKRRDPQGRIMVLDQPMPWKSHLYTIEAEAQSQDQQGGSFPSEIQPAESSAATQENQVLYVLYPESQNTASKWRIQTVPPSEGSFESRKPLPEAWRGVRDDKLDELTGVVPGAIFVHAGGFIGGHKSFEGVLGMAKRALEM